MCVSLQSVKPASTKHLYNTCTMLDQRRRRWADAVQLLYKYFLLAGNRVYCRFLVFLFVFQEKKNCM